MPAESARLRRRLDARDRRFVAVVVAAVALATPAAIVLAERGPGPPAGCVRRLERGFMGAQTVTTCNRRLTGERD